MNHFWKLQFGIALLGLVAVHPALAQQVKLRDGTLLPEKPFYIVAYIEVAPSQADKASGLIRQAQRCLQAAGGEPPVRSAAGNRPQATFLLLEVWEDQAARNEHAKSANTVAFRQSLQPMLYSPYDERLHAPLAAADPSKIAQGGSGIVYVVTHVDIIPPEQFPPCKRQVNENGPCGNALVEKLVADSRKQAGNVRFDALTQSNRPNHMKIVEMWRSAKDHDAHIVHSDTKNFRDGLAGVAPGSGVAADPLLVINPLSGSLYDEQLYALID